MKELKKIIASNLVKYRKHAKLTQLDLAEKLMYSDKNISKWERGDAVPDVVILKQIADIYGVTVNDMLTDTEEISPNANQNIEVKKTKGKVLNKQQMLITLLSIFLVWLVAIVSYGVFYIFTPFKEYAWWSFIIALPISTIVTLVFTSIWCTNLMNSIVVSILIWTTALTLFVCINVPEMWLIFIVAIPLQILDILWFTFRKVNRTIKSKFFKKTNSGDKE